MQPKEFENEIWVGRELGKYKILKLLGCGGMGAVYQAFHTLLDKNVAIKILYPALIHSGTDSLTRFILEAKAAARLEHPNIVQVYDIDKINDVYFIVMQCIEGKTIAQILEERESLPVRQTLAIGIQVAGALDFAHKNGIVHRDVKPANVMVTDDGTVKLTDFGTARWTNFKGTVTATGEVLGTPIYNSPEAILGQPVDARTDMYSLGITLFHMLSGSPPYVGKNPIAIGMQHLDAPIPSIRQQRPEVPEELDALIKKLMAKTPDERFASTEEIVLELGHCTGKVSETDKTEKSHKKEPAGEEDYRAAGQIEVKSPKAKARVLVVDDSQVMCKAICRVLKDNPALEVVGVAHNGKEALEAIPTLKPNVITLDVNMPVMDGVTTLKHIMVQYPMPVIMLSAFTYDGALTTFHCLSYGSVGFIWKSMQANKNEFKQDLLEKIQNAARLELTTSKKPRITKMVDSGKGVTPATWIVVMGAGETGYHCYLKIIPHIPKNIPCAIVAVQEMPDEMVEVFAGYLNHYSRIPVEKAVHRAPLMQGVCYVTNHLAPLRIKRDGPNAVFSSEKGSAPAHSVFRQLLTSAVDVCGHKAIAVALTGKNTDAIEGFRQIRHAGGMVLVQKPENCLNSEVVDLAIQDEPATKAVLDIDIPSVLWHILKKKQGG